MSIRPWSLASNLKGNLMRNIGELKQVVPQDWCWEETNITTGFLHSTRMIKHILRANDLAYLKCWSIPNRWRLDEVDMFKCSATACVCRIECIVEGFHQNQPECIIPKIGGRAISRSRNVGLMCFQGVEKTKLQLQKTTPCILLTRIIRENIVGSVTDQQSARPKFTPMSAASV